MSDSNMSSATAALAAAIVPLTEREQQSAIAAATASLRAELSDRYRILGTELRIDKPREPGGVPNRVIGVYVVDYLEHRSIEALVGAAGEVIAVNDVPPYQFPISLDEVREAQSIAARDESVARAVRCHDVSFLTPFTPHDHASRKRVIGLHYFCPDPEHPRAPLPIGDVEVDLGEGAARFVAVDVEGR